MEYRRLGNTDLLISAVGQGCNNFGMRIDEDQSISVIAAALEAGVTFFDTADVYGDTRSELILGKALGRRRHEVVVATKFGLPIGREDSKACGSRRWIMDAVEGSLRRLRTDYIDLYQLHAPDPATPILETLGALADLITTGKVRHIGCSNLSGTELEAALQAAQACGLPRFESVQNQLSLLKPVARAKILPICRQSGIAFLPYFPLASGLLTGKYMAGRPPPHGSRLASWGEAGTRVLNSEVMRTVELLTDWARARGHTVLQLAFAWLLADWTVCSVIAGATTPDQVRANVAAANLTLGSDEMASIDVLLGQAENSLSA